MWVGSVVTVALERLKEGHGIFTKIFRYSYQRLLIKSLNFKTSMFESGREKLIALQASLDIGVPR